MRINFAFTDAAMKRPRHMSVPIGRILGSNLLYLACAGPNRAQPRPGRHAADHPVVVVVPGSRVAEEPFVYTRVIVNYRDEKFGLSLASKTCLTKSARKDRMLRTLLHDGQDHHDSDGFRLRGLGFSRLDGFSDVVFGFALTLLVVSLEVPKNYEELHHLWFGFLPFGVSFLLLMLVWFGHYTFFRRFGTHDAGTIWLNGLLLFVVLFYVYPLKFLFLTAFGQQGAVMAGGDMREVVQLFSAGIAAIYFLFAALYANGYRQRHLLDLSPVERMLTRNSIVEEFGTGLFGVIVCIVASFIPPRKAGVACLTFMVIGAWKSYMGRRSGKAARRMNAQADTNEPEAELPPSSPASQP